MTATIAVVRIEKSPFYKVTGLPAGISKKIESFLDLYLARGFSKRTIRVYAFDLVIFMRFYQGKKRIVPPLSKIEFKMGPLNAPVLPIWVTIKLKMFCWTRI